MSRRTATVANERARFVIEAELSDISHSELCRRYGISRPTGYRWIERYQAEGLFGLEDRSHAPHSCPHASSPEVVARVLEIRDHRGWGARKIRQKLVVGDGVWSVYFAPVHLGWLDERDFRIMDVKEQSR